jgi:ribose/xylose/arabinose/galactoside ABC-type transport system permease subunit
MATAVIPREQGLSWGRLARLLAGNPGSVRRPIAFLVVAVIASTIASPAFLTAGNLKSLLTSSSFLIVLASGEAFVVLMGMIDLGVESMLSCAGMLASWLVVFHSFSDWEGFLCALAFGAVVGGGVGVIVTRVRVPSFVVTLGTYWGLLGIALLFNGGNYISPSQSSHHVSFSFGGIANSTGGVSNLIFLMLAVVVVAQLVLSYTPVGLWVRAVGSNEQAGKAVGLSTRNLKVMAFVVSGSLAALAGVMIAAWQVSIYPTSGSGMSLQAIAGVILGGVPFTGGRGTVVGAAIGALVIGVINDVIVLVGLSSNYEYIFVAAVLILAGLQARGGEFVK